MNKLKYCNLEEVCCYLRHQHSCPEHNKQHVLIYIYKCPGQRVRLKASGYLSQTIAKYAIKTSGEGLRKRNGTSKTLAGRAVFPNREHSQPNPSQAWQCSLHHCTILKCCIVDRDFDALRQLARCLVQYWRTLVKQVRVIPRVISRK